MPPKYSAAGPSVHPAGRHLGTITKSAVSRHNVALESTPSDVAAELVGALLRYHRQGVARTSMKKYVPEGWSHEHRVSICLRMKARADLGVGLRLHQESHRASYDNLVTCGSVWVCPVCSAKITERRRTELAAAIAAHVAAGGLVSIAAFTVSHHTQDKLAPLLSSFLDAYRYMTSLNAYRSTFGPLLTGTVRSLEVTNGTLNGWHPHCHVLLFQDPSTAPIAPNDLHEALYPLWRASCGRFGLTSTPQRGLVVQSTYGAVSDYLAKYGSESASPSPWGIEDEMTRSHAKRARSFTGLSPFGLLDAYGSTGDLVYRDLFREFAYAFKGRARLYWSRGLRAHFGLDEITDEEIAARIDQGAVLLGRLTDRQWAIVVHTDNRAQLLTAAERGGWSAVLACVEQLACQVLEVVQ